MSSLELETALREVALGGFRYFDSIGSTNDVALEWASQGAPDLSLVAADAQVNGRGREGRKWFSLPGAGLACSLVLRPTAAERQQIGRFSGLGALALVKALQKHGLTAQIKWPNDVLIRGKKVAGILIETVWLGTEIESLVLGLGVNSTPAALPSGEVLNFPATCVETELGRELARFDLLRDLLVEFIQLRSDLASDGFLNAWQAALAFRGQRVLLWQGDSRTFTAELLGLEQDGSLRVRMDDGKLDVINFGEVHLRPEVG